WKLEDFSDEGERILLSNGIRHGSINKNTYTIKSGDPLSAKVECDWELTVGRGKDWNTKLVTNSVMTSDKDYFYLENTLLAYLNDEEFFERTWKEKIARDFQSIKVLIALQISIYCYGVLFKCNNNKKIKKLY